MPNFEEEAFARAQQLPHSRPNGSRDTASDRTPRREPAEHRHERNHEHIGERSDKEKDKIPEPPRDEKPSPDISAPRDSGSKQGLLDTLFKDKERTLILALIALLFDSEGDPSLLLALMYLLM